ncbi:MAG: DUF6279 family lipoprotein [Burkholderiaceae bacterium]
MLLASCSLARIGYTWAPTLLSWELGRYVTLSAKQQKESDELLKSLFEWHQRTQLPAYVAFLDDVDHRLSGIEARLRAQVPNGAGAPPSAPAKSDGSPLTAAELVAWRARAKAAWETVARQLAGPVASQVRTFTDEQLAEVGEAMARKHREAMAKYQQPDIGRRIEARHERWQQRLEQFIGPLTERQRATLGHRVAALTDSTDWWAEREQRQQRLLAVLTRVARERPPMPEATAAIEALLLHWSDGRTPQMRQLLATLTRESEALVIAVLDDMTLAQVRRARETLRGYANDLRPLLPASASVDNEKARPGRS